MTDSLSHSSIRQSFLINQQDTEDLVLVFTNPFDVGPYKETKLKKEIPSSEAKDFYLNMFRMSPESPMLSPSLEKIEPLSARLKIPLREICQLIIPDILKILQEYLGLSVSCFLSGDKDQIFILLRSSEHNLKVQADLIDYKFQFTAEASGINETSRKNFQAVLPYAPFEKTKDETGALVHSQAKDFEKHYQTYDQNGNPTANGNLFRYNDRVRLVYSMINSVFETSNLLSIGLLHSVFPMHTKEDLDELKKNWGNFRTLFKPQPIEKIRNYYGEKITFYFAWLEFYIKWLFFLLVVGIITGMIVYINGFGNNDTLNSVTLLIFSLIIAISSTFLDQLWVRKENVFSWKWGTSDVKISEEQRPSFKGKYLKDEVSGKMKKIFKPVGIEKYINLMGYGVVLLFVGVVIAAIVAIFTFKSRGELDAGWAGIINALQIKILNIVSYN